MSDYTAPDKCQHALAGFAIGATSALAVDHIAPDLHPALKFVAAQLPVIAAGVGKELLDAQSDHHTAEREDAVATIAGGALCVRLSWRF